MFLDFHTHYRSGSAEVLSIVNVRYPAVPADTGPISLGIHPYDAGEGEVNWSEVAALMALPEVKVIGEAGLDLLKGGVQQEQIFLKQVRIAESCKKPMVLHCVKAFNEVIAIRKLMQPRQAWAIHGFNRKADLAHSLINRGFFLSFGKSLLDKESVQEAFQHCPLDRVFLETDDAKEVKIQEVYAKAAALKNRNVEDLKLEILKNFYERFVMAFPV